MDDSALKPSHVDDEELLSVLEPIVLHFTGALLEHTYWKLRDAELRAVDQQDPPIDHAGHDHILFTVADDKVVQIAVALRA